MNRVVFENVSKRYNGQAVLEGFSLEIRAGERVVVFGPSGCGKTTVLRLLAGFIPPDAGRIAIGGETVSEAGRILKAPERRNLGMVFQDLALWPHLDVGENLAFGLKARGVPKKERERRVAAMLETVRLQSALHAKPAELSGGQQQRVALARALVQQPKILLMDEPLSSLDQTLNRQLRKEILRLHEKLGFALLYVTHSRDEADEIGTRTVAM